MEVDKSNYFDLLPRIEASIADCDFMALDLEMTGLNSGKMERQKPWDSAQQRYLKVRDGASVVCPTQFGLCTFKYIASTNRYEASKRHFTLATFLHRFLSFLALLPLQYPFHILTTTRYLATKCTLTISTFIQRSINGLNVFTRFNPPHLLFCASILLISTNGSIQVSIGSP